MATNNKSLSGPQLLLISLALAGAAVICNLIYIAKIQEQVSQSSIKVFVLTKTLQPGEVLHAADLKTIEVPKAFASSLNDLSYIDAIAKETRVGDKVTTIARQGELLTARMFTSSSDETSETNITIGRRLISLAINPRTAPAMLHAGVYVDLEGSFNTTGAIPEVITVMERVEIKAVGSRTINDEAAMAAGERPHTSTTNANTITIEVSPNDASVLAALQRIIVGNFELQIRNPNDSKAEKLPGVATLNPRLVEMVRVRQTEPGPPKR